MKRLLCLFLTLLFILPVLFSCGDNSGTKTSATTAENPASTTLPSEEERDIFEGLEIKDFGGKTFNMLVRDNYATEFIVDGETGEIINDAVYQRNRAVEDRFNVKIEAMVTPGNWDNKDKFMGALRSSVMAGDGAFDLVDGYSAYIGDMIPSGLLINLLDVPHLRLTEGWWSQNAVEELTINGKLFVVPGDISINLWANMQTIFFNKKLFEDNALESPYNLVKNGKWTIDTVVQMAKGMSKDLNGDTVMDISDQYGFLFYDGLQFNNFHAAFNVPITLRDEEGMPYFNLGSPEVTTLAQLVMDLVYNTDGIAYIKPPGDAVLSTYSLDMFSVDQVLIMPCLLGFSENLRAMESSFGIVPYPKLNTEQDTYYTMARDNHTMFAIPTDVKDVDFTGLITEALCVASNRIVVPAYYEKALKTKYARDEESAEMLDLIREGLTFDIGAVFVTQLNFAGLLLQNSIQEKRAFVSYYESQQKAMDNAMSRFLEHYKD